MATVAQKQSTPNTQPSTPAQVGAKKFGNPPTAAEIQKTIADNGGTKSAAIRTLLASGKSRSEVAHMLQIRYQHVRNVAITPVKQARDANQGQNQPQAATK